MPGKVNPVIPEVVNQVCFRVIGNDTTVMMAAEGWSVGIERDGAGNRLRFVQLHADVDQGDGSFENFVC